jgi:isopentenyldiphosphate isomerase
MKKDELLDLVDNDDMVVGTVYRSAAHKNSALIHREIAVVLFTKDGEVLLQQRSMKKSSPGAWKITAAGHVESGEDPRRAAEREVLEELGASVDLIYHGKIFRDEINEAKFYWIYYQILDEKPELDLDEDEVMDARWVKVDRLEEFSEENDYSLKSDSHEIIVKIASKLKLI